MKFYYVYVLQNRLKNFIYIGYSEGLKQRILSHNKGENKSTKAYLPLELIHYEAYRNMADAKQGKCKDVKYAYGSATSNAPNIYSKSRFIAFRKKVASKRR